MTTLSCSTSADAQLPVGNRRTPSNVTRKLTRVSALQDDVTPRRILGRILQTGEHLIFSLLVSDLDEEFSHFLTLASYVRTGVVPPVPGETCWEAASAA